ncbi:hypothetical protein OG21DRAFT_1489116 [Imleria badia]|nr:hypothetical protein OG21DRAFT_1489116 [Imleria badia]
MDRTRMLIVGEGQRDPPVEIHHDGWVSAVAFSANGEYLVGSGENGVRVWRVADGEQIASMEEPPSVTDCLAVSQDGRWIAGGMSHKKIIVWDAKTCEKFFLYNADGNVYGVDFSPDSTRLVAAVQGDASSESYSVICDIATRKQVQTLDHPPYIPFESGTVTTVASSGISRARCNDHLLVNSCGGRRDSGTIQQIDAATGTISAEWPADLKSCIATPNHGEFIAYSTTRHSVAIWDTSTRTQRGLIQHSPDIRSIALSPDGGFLTIAYLNNLLSPYFHTEPDIRIDDAALDLWKHDQLTDTAALLTTAIATSQNPSHDALASRAIVRARLRQWDQAVDDAEKSINIQPSVIGYIAKSIALVGKGEKHKAYRACDIAFDHFHPSRLRLMLLIKAIVAFMAGEHDDAISRVDDLIPFSCNNSICYVVQARAYMHLLLGNLRIENRHYEGAIRSFERAHALMRPHTNQGLSVVSLITGWKFDDLGIRIREHLCEALYAASRAMQACEFANVSVSAYLCDSLYAASRAKQAGESLLKMTHLFNEEIHIRKDLTQWVSDFTRRCLAIPDSSEFTQWCSSTRKSDGDAAAKPSPLLSEWAKATLMMNGSWSDALTASVDFTPPRFTIYRAICECLETIDRILDASKCFLQMVNELAEETAMHSEQAEWVVAFGRCCTQKLEHLGDGAADAKQHDAAITWYSAALSLNLPIPHVFMKRSKLYMAKGLWKDALGDVNQAMMLDPTSWNYDRVLLEWTTVNLKNDLWKYVLSAARNFKVPRIMTYQIICEGLESVEGIMDAIECFHQMASELTQEAFSEGEQAKWFHDFKHRCREKVERFGDGAMDSQQLDEALKYYAAALPLHSANTQRFSILESKVCIAKGSWKDAVKHANEAIALDPSSPWGYQSERTALHGAGRYDDAIQAFETMLSKIAQSPDLHIREHRDQYISPSSVRAQIRKVVQRTIRHSPHVLINTTTGRLLNKAEQAAAFMSLPIVSELVTSDT